jgi:crotonobetainyl-CoA:carnitine CoA-transferase CaiB-like acyl-CoA transferase
MQGLRDVRVLDLTHDIAGPYATKLFADAGADVVKIEPPGGDPLRAWSATGGLGEVATGGAPRDGALFRFLNFGKRSVVGSWGDEAVRALIAGADLVFESLAPGALDGSVLARSEPGLVVVSISPFGRSGPYANRPATEFSVQAHCGSIGTRGLPGREPFQAGGRTAEWLAGTFAAVAALAALNRARRTGLGEYVDFSILEVMNLAGTNYSDLMCSLLGVTPRGPLPQSIETPSIEPTADGYVGFCTNSRQQFSDFLLLIGRPDLRDDEQLAQVAGRVARLEEWNAAVHAYTRSHTTAEIVEAASSLRIPVSPVNDGDDVRRHEQLVARGVFREAPEDDVDPAHGRPDFLHPRPPWRIDDEDPPRPRRAPRLGEHQGRIEARVRNVPRPLGQKSEDPLGRELPLAGLRVVDLTAWWAGPSATHMLACLGADVIHVESPGRLDGMRMVGGMLRGVYEAWWECSSFFLAANSNKRGLAIDLADPRGREALLRLVEGADAVVENFTPRVMDNLGLGWDVLRERNPGAILVRMPAFGLTGPWRDHTGFAQTMEQMTGLAWLTGHADDQPRIQRGPCDPLAGMHAAFALLLALEERSARGRGVHVECTMVEGALNAAAEQLVELTAYGRRMTREGNRSPAAAPQGLYPCLGSEPGREQWLALSVASDLQWAVLREVLGDPAWAVEPSLSTHAGRRARHDEIDAQLRPWIARRERSALVEELVARGVPAAPVADPRRVRDDPQLLHRGFFECFEHPVVGAHFAPAVPFRYASVERWLRTPAPTLGQHNREILRELCGLSDAEVDDLEAQGVIGNRPLRV